MAAGRFELSVRKQSLSSESCTSWQHDRHLWLTAKRLKTTGWQHVFYLPADQEVI